MASLKRILGSLILLWPVLAMAQVQQPANGGTGTGTAPSTGQIMVGQSSGKYAPKTVNGSCTADDNADFSCSGGGGGFNGINAQTSSYTALSGDNGKNIVFNCPSSCSLTLPSTPPSSTWAISVQNTSQVALGITVPGSLTLDGLAGAASLTPNMGTLIWTDGTNYFTERGAIISRSNTVPTLVQSFLLNDNTGPACSNFTVTPCNSITAPSNVSPGSALVVEFYHSNGGTVNTPTDTQGDTFVQTNNQLVAGYFNFLQYVACNVVGGPTTVNMAGSNDWNMIAVYEVSGAAASSCVDANNSQQTNTSTTVGTGSITTTAAYDFILVTGAGRTGTTGGALSEANSYTNLFQSGNVANLYYGSWYGIKNATGSVSDTVTSTVLFNGSYAGIVALKPTAASAAFAPGDLVVAGSNKGLQSLHPGTSGTALISNGPGALPSYQSLPSNPLSGMTATQVPIAASANSITSSKPLGGSGAVIPTGPASSGSGNCVEFTGTSGQLADTGAPCSTSTQNYVNIGGGAVTWAVGSGAGSYAGGVFTVSTAASSITISAIPGTYLNLELTVAGTNSSGSFGNTNLQFNGDTGSNYDYYNLRMTATGTSSTSPNYSGGATSLAAGTLGASSTYGSGSIVQIIGYSQSLPKLVIGHGIAMSSGTSSIYLEEFRGNWRSSSAVTSIKLTPFSGNFVAGSQIQIHATN